MNKDKKDLKEFNRNKRLEIKLKHKEVMKQLDNQSKQIELEAYSKVLEMDKMMLNNSHIMKFQPVKSIYGRNYKNIKIKYRNPSKKFKRNKDLDGTTIKDNKLVKKETPTNTKATK